MIEWTTYINRILSISTQFDIARKGINAFLDTPESVNKYVTRGFEDLKDIIDSILKAREDTKDSIWVWDKDSVANFAAHQLETLNDSLNDINNRLNQNELILIVSVFESFMKDLHREILIQNPSLLRSDRKIDLGKIISIGEDSIVREEIEKEVYGLDRKNIHERAKYYKLSLGIDIDKRAIDFAAKALLLRNKILHEDSDTPISSQDIGLAMVASVSITLICALNALKLYPKGFENLEPLNLDLVSKYLDDQSKCYEA